MLWSNKLSKSAGSHLKGRRAPRARSLGGEPLEPRLALDGTVLVTLSGTTLTLEGDIDANDVLIRKGPNPNEILIEGKDRDGYVTTFINGPTLIDDPVDQIMVELLGGSDDFRIQGNSPQDRIVLPGPLQIRNGDGNNVNRLENVVLVDNLQIAKVAGNGESTLEVVGTDVVATALISNSPGPTKTMITSGSTFQDSFLISNGDGRDIFVVDNSSIDGDLAVSNGNGDTRTVFGMSEDPIVFGDMIITNGLGNDTYVLNDTDVWGRVLINNRDGHSDTTLSNSRVALGEPAAAGNTVFRLACGAGTDSFLMTESFINDELLIEYAQNVSDTFGSSTRVSDSTIRGFFYLESDNGYDRADIDRTTAGQNFELYFFDGSSDTTLSDLTVGLEMFLEMQAGADNILLERTTVNGYVDLQTNDGIDRLEILDGSRLLGQTLLRSGNGVDTFVRQLGPGAQAVDIVFLLLEDFELDQFVL